MKDRDALTPHDLDTIRTQRKAAKERLETALEGEDLTEIKAAHTALKVTDAPAQSVRIALAAQLRQRVQSSVSHGLGQLQNQASSPHEFETRLMVIVDMMIEHIAKID